MHTCVLCVCCVCAVCVLCVCCVCAVCVLCVCCVCAVCVLCVCCVCAVCVLCVCCVCAVCVLCVCCVCAVCVLCVCCVCAVCVLCVHVCPTFHMTSSLGLMMLIPELKTSSHNHVCTRTNLSLTLMKSSDIGAIVFNYNMHVHVLSRQSSFSLTLFFTRVGG